MSNSYPRCYPDGGRRGSSKQKHVHQQLIQLKSAAAAIAALATTPAARVLTLNSRIFANFKVYKVHAACCMLPRRWLHTVAACSSKQKQVHQQLIYS